jgi:hypothetical protein
MGSSKNEWSAYDSTLVAGNAANELLVNEFASNTTKRQCLCG